VEAGAAYLRELLIKYDGDPRKALAAYNAGPGAVDKYNGVPPYAETQTYIERVLRKYKKSTDSESGQ
jgi:soluble lytic murein transglycosylase-like protein